MDTTRKASGSRPKPPLRCHAKSAYGQRSSKRSSKHRLLHLNRASRNALIVSCLISKVRSGDPDNFEAQAAQRYWPELLGRGFTRDRNGSHANSSLNYGYTVLRAAAARSIIGAGLHPSLSLHHKSNGDALCLADDLIEPFRPAVDLLALELTGEDAASLARPQRSGSQPSCMRTTRPMRASPHFPMR